jgi:hypothetical protein
MSPFEDRSVHDTEDDQVLIQQELEKLEIAIERLLLQDPIQICNSRNVKQPPQHQLDDKHDKGSDKSGDSFLSGVRRKSGIGKLLSSAKRGSSKTEKKEIIEKIRRLQAACEGLKVFEAIQAEERDGPPFSPVMTDMKETCLEVATFDIEAIVAASKTLEDTPQERKPTRAAPTTTLKSVVACQEILSATTFNPQADIEVSLYSAKLETQVVNYRRTIPMVLTLPDNESNDVSFKEQVETIYNAFRLQSEKRTKLKHAVFSWLLKNGTSFYAESTPEDRFARRKRGPKWAKKIGSLTEQDILEAGLKVVKKRVKEISQSLKIQTDKQRMHFKTMLLSWLSQLENGGVAGMKEATILLRAPDNEPVGDEQIQVQNKPETFIRTYSTRDIEGSLLLSGLELLDTDSALRIIGVKDKLSQSDKVDFTEFEINEGGSHNVLYSNDSTESSTEQDIVIDETQGCNLFYGLFLNSLDLCQSTPLGETNLVAQMSEGDSNEKTRDGGMLSDVELTKSETSLEGMNELKASVSNSITQPVSTKAHFTTTDDEGDMALVNALVELLSQEKEYSEVLEETQKASFCNSLSSDDSIDRNSTTTSPRADAESNSKKDLIDEHGTGTQDTVSGRIAYINSSASCETKKSQTSLVEDRIENAPHKQTSMIRSMIYNRSFRASHTILTDDGKGSGKLESKASKMRGRSPPPPCKAEGMDKDANRDLLQRRGTNVSKNNSGHKRTEDAPLNDASDTTNENIERLKAVSETKEASLTVKGSAEQNILNPQKDCSKRNTIDDLPAKQSTLILMARRPARTKRLRYIRKESTDKIFKVKEQQNDAPESARSSKETPSGKPPTRAKQRLWKKENGNVTSHTRSISSNEGERTKNVMADQRGRHDETLMRNIGPVEAMIVNPPTRRYGQSPNRKSRRSRSRRRRAPPKCFQPKLPTHYETTSFIDDDDDSEILSDEQDEDESHDSREDEVNACGNDGHDNDVDSVASEDETFRRVPSERVDSFEMLQEDTSDSSSESIDNVVAESGSTTEGSVFSSFALLLNRFNGSSNGSDDDENSDESDEDEEENLDGNDVSYSSSENDSSIETDSGSSDHDQNEEDREGCVQVGSTEMDVKQQPSRDNDSNNENRMKEHDDKAADDEEEQSKSAFMVSNRPFGRRPGRGVKRSTNARGQKKSQPKQSKQQLQNLTSLKEDERREEQEGVRSSHKRRPTPQMIVLGENLEIEVGRVMTPPLPDCTTSEDSEELGMVPETKQMSMQSPGGTISASQTSSTKKAWYFLSLRKSDRPQHYTLGNRSAIDNPALVHVLDDDIINDHKKNKNYYCDKNESRRRECEAPIQVFVDCRDDDGDGGGGRSDRMHSF